MLSIIALISLLSCVCFMHVFESKGHSRAVIMANYLPKCKRVEEYFKLYVLIYKEAFSLQ